MDDALKMGRKYDDVMAMDAESIVGTTRKQVNLRASGLSIV